MHREEVFSRSGYYRFLLDSNALLHREAVGAATGALGPMLQARPPDTPARVLDLACGGWPTAIAAVMAAFPDQAFAYTGVDINPDQVELARTLFEFPGNVDSVCILEGNAWELEPLPIARDFDLIFSGMNLHHGTPEELQYLAGQLRGALAPGGLFLSHDVYRPDSAPYRRRPDVNPDDSTESFALIDVQRLQGGGAGPLELAEDAGQEEPAWRGDYLERMRRTLLARGGDPVGTESTIAHMRRRDYPVSTNELSQILSLAGFSAEVRRFDDSGEPLAPYVAFCVARPADR